MKRKGLSHMAIELIEEALTKPGSEIFLESRIKKQVCEPTVSVKTESQLNEERKYLLEKVLDFSSTTETYNNEVSKIVHGAGVLYNNGSLIMLRDRNEKKYDQKD